MTYPVFIIGAGGWGREVLAQMRSDPDCGKIWTIGGFLDSRKNILDGYGLDVPIIGDPMTYECGNEEAFVCAVGDPYARHSFVQPLLSQKARFVSLHHKAYLNPRVRFAHGCILCNRAQFSPDVKLGAFVNVHSNSIIGHDVQVGAYAQIGPMVFVGGNARIGAFATIHPHAAILPGRQVGVGATVGAGAVIVQDVPAGATAFGNPARVIFRAELNQNFDSRAV